MRRDKLGQSGLPVSQFSLDKLPTVRAIAIAVAIIVAGCFAARCMAQQAGQKTFPSAGDACKALVQAVQNNDEKAMLEILGPGNKSSRRETNPRTRRIARNSCRDFWRCTAW